MPRVTRAALRSNAMLEEANIASSTPLPLTPLLERAPLGEIAGNAIEVVDASSSYNKVKKGEKKGSSKTKKGRVKAKKAEPPVMNENTIDVLEDDNQSTTSSAADEARQELLKESSGDIHPIVIHDQRSYTPPSPAVNAVHKHLTPKELTPTSNHSTHQVKTMATPGTTNDTIVSAVAANEPDTAAVLPSPASLDQETEKNEGQNGSQDEDGSYVKNIMTASPSKPVTRIEDSVEAIDAFEEAIEKVGELIPVITKDSRKTARVQQQRMAVSEPDANQVNMAVPEPTRKSMTSTRSITAGSGNQAGKPKASLRRQTAAPSPPKSAAKQTATPMTRSRVASAGFAMNSGSSSKQASVKTRAAVKRISSIHKAPFQPTKSTKPPTRPSFELPGDAVARKLKEQREERLKRDEEAPKKSAFKARPVRLSQAPIVKPTATSKARMSLAKLDATKSFISNDRAPKSRPPTRPGSTPVVETNKRLSTAPNPQKVVRTSAVMTDRVVSHSGSGQAAASGKVGLADDNRSNVTAFEAAQQKIRGKEVFNRIRIEQDERERAKKVKEEAARKARADAAERGRVASREWAEKQKLKKMGSEKNGDSKSGLASI